MAKFTPGPTVAAVSGSIGGTVYSRNRYGAYMRFRAVPITSTTSWAMNAKARFAAASQAWQAESDADREAWNQFAIGNPVTDALGFQQELTGHAAYVGSYARLTLIGSTPLSVPPVEAPPASLLTMSITADLGVGGMEITYTATPTGAADYLWIDGAIVNSAGVEYVENLYRYVGVSGAAEASPFDYETLFIARLGTPQVDQTVHLRVGVIDSVTGLVSAKLTDSAVVVDTV